MNSDSDNEFTADRHLEDQLASEEDVVLQVLAFHTPKRLLIQDDELMRHVRFHLEPERYATATFKYRQIVKELQEANIALIRHKLEQIKIQHREKIEPETASELTAKEVIIDLKKENSKLTTENSALYTKLEDARDRHNRLVTEQRRLQKDNQLLTTRNQDLNTGVDSLERQLGEAVDSHNKVAQEVNKLTADNHTLKQRIQYSHIDTKSVSTPSANTEMAEELSASKRKVIALNDVLGTLKEQNKALEISTNDAWDRVDEERRMVRDLTDLINRQAGKEHGHVEALQRRNKLLDGALDNHREVLNKVRRELHEDQAAFHDCRACLGRIINHLGIPPLDRDERGPWHEWAIETLDEWDFQANKPNMTATGTHKSSTKHENAWLWQGDGYDFPESLSCPVIMTPDTVRDILRKKKEAEDNYKSAVEDYKGAVSKFDECRSCLARLAERMGMPTDDHSKEEWHKELIRNLDDWDFSSNRATVVASGGYAPRKPPKKM
jgi:hypothetical protein